MQSLLKGADEISHVPNEEKVRLIVECYCSFVIALVHRKAAGKDNRSTKKSFLNSGYKKYRIKEKVHGETLRFISSRRTSKDTSANRPGLLAKRKSAMWRSAMWKSAMWKSANSESAN